MACSSCGQGRSVGSPQSSARAPKVRVSNEDCIYTIPILENWKTRFECVKANSTYNLINSSEAEINGFLGVVLSALSNPSNICYFASHLSTIGLTIVKIINSGQC